LSSKKYIKTLNKSDAKYRYWRLTKKDRDFFPDENIEFKVEFAGKTITLKIKYGTIIPAGQFYEKYKFLENDRIIFTEKEENVYLMEAPDTQSYSEV